MKQRASGLKVFAFLCSLSLLASACIPDRAPEQSVSQATSSPSPDGPILIGGALCATGLLGFADGRALLGAQLAVDELNNKGGVLGRKVEFTNLDCQSDDKKAAEVTIELIHRGAKAIITPGSYYFSAPSAREAQKGGVVGVSTTSSSSLYNSKILGDKQFTISMWNNTMGAAAAEFAYKMQGWRSVYIVTEKSTDYPRSLSRYFNEHFTRLGGEITGEDSFSTGENDFSGQLARLTALPRQPDFLFVSTGPPNIQSLILALRSGGITLPILGGDSYDDPDTFKAIGPEAGNGIYFVTHTFIAPDVTPDMAHFIELYQAKYGKMPDGLAAPGWDVVMLLAQAMEKAGSTDGAAVAKAMETTEFNLLTGKLRWSSAADGHQPDIEAAIVGLENAEPKFIGWVHPSGIPAP